MIYINRVHGSNVSEVDHRVHGLKIEECFNGLLSKVPKEGV
jgi:hypothetical protein